VVYFSWGVFHPKRGPKKFQRGLLWKKFIRGRFFRGFKSPIKAANPLGATSPIVRGIIDQEFTFGPNPRIWSNGETAQFRDKWKRVFNPVHKDG